jgi:lipopolysaccharide heptosyltransferase II
MHPVKNIIIRLPNWLGDLVMSTAFVKAVQHQYPAARVDLVTKKGIDFLLDYFPAHGKRFVFDKTLNKGVTGAWQFGRMLRREQKYDLFFCLPDSMSSAIMARASGARKVIGFKKELRSALLTQSFTKQKGLHRVEEYINLLEQFTKTNIAIPAVELVHPVGNRKNVVVININSEAVSRRLPVTKAISLINSIRRAVSVEIILVGSPKERSFVDSVYFGLADTTGIQNVAGKTSLPALVELLGSSALVLTTDSGPAHVSNAMQTHTIVLFGAGNENNTAPFNKDKRTIIRLGKLSCEPCVSNTCKQFGIPECLIQLDENLIASTIIQILKFPANVI